jgi:toxin ParE1/3/4
MSARYRLSPAAQHDLDDIWTFTRDNWGSKQARQYIRSVRDACEALAQGRKRGRSIDRTRAGYFRLAVGSHVLFYRLEEQTASVVVIRILHQRMDPTGRLGG